MRVCFYIASDGGSQLGGVEHVLATIIAGLPERFEVTVLAPSSEVAKWVAAARTGASWTELPRLASKWDAKGFLQHLTTLRQFKPDVLHVSHNQLWDGQYALLAARLLDIPTVSVVHFVQPPSYRLQPLLFSPLFRHTAVGAAVSRAVCTQVENVLGLPVGSLRVAYNGVRAPEAQSRLVGDRSAGSANGLSIGAVGRMTTEKGFDGLIRALVEVPEAELTLIGDGPERPALEELARKLRVDGRIEWAGWHQGSWSERWRFDVLAVPSTMESFGLVAVEAMLVGIPVVATAVGGLPEVVEDGVDGLIVPPGDPSALAAALRRLQDDPQLRSTMGRAAATRARTRFSEQAMIDCYVDMFDEALGTRRRRSSLVSPSARRWRPWTTRV